MKLNNVGRCSSRHLNSRSASIDFIVKPFEVYVFIADKIAFFKLSNSLSGITVPVLNPMFSDIVCTKGIPKNYNTSANNLTSLYGTRSSSSIFSLLSSLIFCCGTLVVLPLMVDISLPYMSLATVSSCEVNG